MRARQSKFTGYRLIFFIECFLISMSTLSIRRREEVCNQYPISYHIRIVRHIYNEKTAQQIRWSDKRTLTNIEYQRIWYLTLSISWYVPPKITWIQDSLWRHPYNLRPNHGDALLITLCLIVMGNNIYQKSSVYDAMFT